MSRPFIDALRHNGALHLLIIYIGCCVIYTIIGGMFHWSESTVIVPLFVIGIFVVPALGGCIDARNDELAAKRKRVLSPIIPPAILMREDPKLKKSNHIVSNIRIIDLDDPA